MIARTTLALMLACPAAALAAAVIAPHPALAEARKSPRDSDSSAQADGTASSSRRSRSERLAARRGTPDPSMLTVSGTYDDGLAYDTPRDANGRPLPEPEPIPLAAAPRTGHPWQTGMASWYGGSRWQGHLTSSGERYDQDKLTAAHASLPLGSRARVRLIDGEREVVVTITDRPGTRRRIIDLSRGAASQLGILSRGIARVEVDPM